MRKWSDKFVIGLTGNIATGKSVVRKMLEHLGAYGIDADALAHRVIAKGAPGYLPVLSTFGGWMLNENSEINRQKLGRLVFSDPEALVLLEGIIHPFVSQAIDLIVKRAPQRTIVIEAIKLLETDLVKSCDSIWTTFSPERTQLARLMGKRGMSDVEALKRIRMQPSQAEKVAKASVVIHNLGSFEDTWRQVKAAWRKVIPPSTDTAPTRIRKASHGELAVQRGRPGDSQAIANLITQLSNGVNPQTSEGVMAAFGEKAFLLLKLEKKLVGLAAWQVENLVARTTDIYVDANIALPHALKVLIAEVESASRDLQCEASLVFLSPALTRQAAFWKELGYESRNPTSLSIQAWQDAVNESMPANTTLFFKQLRQDRILRPI
ncbi:MAG: dephospho-CoA kinase [Chloroflexi bacterium GWB2_49_20]|nr:MAG: dephospho-CoA kinase [Chloroflexi bacterium GWB2_49_20]OGN80178.1 MAG: dephospho-CoA kinase [Chloroflexi bacterium GWC2_49_37]OGN83151.1 MAG: dephospho-CoA kinase [Chloroflexi bacterium GWD2_49_16]